uniref:Integrase, catalytic region, zinc finger, CCHC-type, peptidase aspartic, catalytic n=1 Tax=Tanacetum cinerariifolium TaxID=118510 RepID=A0A6L2MSS6_TANCI|nr:hypothetical protein [Tanacetum cinerariifolium]
MLDKDLYDSWKSRMELYMKNREHERMILESVEHGPLIWPTIEENKVIRTKKYAELSAAEKIQADCDMKATNIILQGLPSDIYSLFNHHRVSKDLWERIQLLMQGISLTKQDSECKLYDAFDKFVHIKGESLHQYYLRFTQLINDMNIYNMKLEQFQVNTKFLNSLPLEWSKFVNDVKLVKDLHTTNFDQLHVYLKQYELHSNKATIQDDRVIVQQVEGRQGQSYSATGYKSNASSSGGNNLSRHARVVKCYNCQDPGVSDGQVVHTIILNNAAFQTEDLDTYDFECDDISNAKVVLMANISNYGSDVISKNTLAEYMILSSAGNRPIMLDKDLVSKDLWEIIQLLMQGISLTKQDRECKLYDAFDKFVYIKGESLHKYYLRFTQLINDMNIYNMKLEQFQVNTKFLNSLPLEWSKFINDVKLVKDLHTTNFDQLHAYLEQYELHSNEEAGQILDEEQLTFLADPGVLDGQVVHTIILNNAAFQTEDLDTYDFDCDDISNAKVVLIANISNYGSDVISKVPHSETYLNDLEN